MRCCYRVRRFTSVSNGSLRTRHLQVSLARICYATHTVLKVHTQTLKLLLISSLLFWAPAVLFLSIADEVREHKPLYGDVGILESVHHTFSGSFSGFFLFWTSVGSAGVIAAITALLIAVLLYLKKRRSAMLVAFGVGGAAAANVVLKALFQRQRPSLWQSVVHEHSFSFPSGHAMASSALAFCIVAICWRTSWRWAAVVGGALFMLFVGTSRLYFGVHYPSDVVGGWLASLAWVALVAYVVERPQLFERLRSKFRNSKDSVATRHSEASDR